MVSMYATPWGLPLDDLHASVEAASADLETLRGARVLVTGGTGFLGSWLVASLLQANVTLGLDLSLVLVSRHPSAVPLEEGPSLRLVGGDVRSLRLEGSFEVVLHGAASSSARYGIDDGEPRAMAATILEGTQAVLELACASRARLLFLSSGAVYGPQVAPVGEEATTGPDPMDPRSTYGQAKRLAETLCAAASAAGEVEAVVARLFAFVGPRLPLEVHYAAGNFLGAAVAGRPVRVLGDGRPLRSYLYAGDLPEWCWALLSRGVPGRAYNVGSPAPLSIAELARRIAALAPEPLPVEILGAPQSGPAPCYVPSTDRAGVELGLRPRTDLDLALRKSYAWFASHRRAS